MLTNETRRNILDRVKASGYPGGVSEAFRAAEQGIDVVDQFVQQQQLEQQQQAEQAQVQVQGQGQEMAEGNQSPPPPPPQNTPDGRVSQPNINNPIDNNQGHLVQSQNTQNVGIQSLPTGSAQGQIIQAKNGGVRRYENGGLDLENETKKQRKKRIKNYSHPYLNEYIEEFAKKGISNKNTVKDIMSSMYITPSDTAFIAPGYNTTSVQSDLGFDVRKYIMDKENTNTVNSEGNAMKYHTTEKDEYGDSWDFMKKFFNNDNNQVTGVLKSRKKYGGVRKRGYKQKYETGGDKEEFPGLLPEVEVSALTDESYNKLSDPQKQVYDTFVTPQGIAQTVDLGDNRSMHYKSALQMTEDLGVRNISNKPSFVFNKFLNRKKEGNPNFTPHAIPILKSVTIPPHSLYKDRSTFGNHLIKKLQDNEGYWAQNMTEQERADEIRKFQDAQTGASRRAYFDKLIAEYAHIPEFWRKETFINKPVSLAKDAGRLMNWAFKKAKRIGPDISLKQATDAPRYADEDHYEYKTHRGPDSFEEKLKNKYEMKKQGGIRRYNQGGRRKRGYVQKHPHGGFHFNPADFDPNYDQGSVQDNTQVINNKAIIESNENEKDAEFYNKLLSNYNASDKKTSIPTPAQQQVLTSKNYMGSRAIINKENQIPVREDKLIDNTKRNAAIINSHSMLTNQLAGGYGGSNMRKSIETNPEKTEEIYKNTMRSSGQNTMKWNALGVAAVGSGFTGLGGATNYINHMGRGVDFMRKANRIRPFVKGLFQTGYNATKLGALPTFYNQTGDFGVDLATGNYNDLGQSTRNFVRGVVSTHPGLRKMKDYYKMGQDAYEGNYADVINRGVGLGVKAPGIGKGLEYYTSKVGGKFIPESWQNLGGLPSLKSIFNKYTKPKATTSDAVPLIKAG